jgi:hypothetical protein
VVLGDYARVLLHGERRAGYGDEVIERLAERLARRLGKGFGARTLWRLRQFYQLYPSGSLLGSPVNAARMLTAPRTKSGSQKILTAPRTKSGSRKILTAPQTESASAPAAAFPPNLGWAHYRVLLNVANDDARAFYEIEAAREGLKLVPADWPRAGEGAAA